MTGVRPGREQRLEQPGVDLFDFAGEIIADHHALAIFDDLDGFVAFCAQQAPIHAG